MESKVAMLCFELFPLVDQTEQVKFGLTGRVFELIRGLARQLNLLQTTSMMMNETD